MKIKRGTGRGKKQQASFPVLSLSQEDAIRVWARQLGVPAARVRESLRCRRLAVDAIRADPRAKKPHRLLSRPGGKATWVTYGSRSVIYQHVDEHGLCEGVEIRTLADEKARSDKLWDELARKLTPHALGEVGQLLVQGGPLDLGRVREMLKAMILRRSDLAVVLRALLRKVQRLVASR